MIKLIHKYISVTKPSIVFVNLISVIGGFLLAAQGNVIRPLFIATLLGVSLVIASGCVFNNHLDRDIDRVMQRTRNRVLVRGLISPAATLCYATVLGLLGLFVLLLAVNTLTTIIALLGFIVYVGLYTLYMKRRSVYGTLIGSLSGAAPPVIGYCAVSNQLDVGALILLSIFSLWQMPHSYAIAICRYDDYVAASIPVLPVVRGIPITKHHITLYIIAFTIATLMLTLSGYTGYHYLAVASAVSLCWLGMALSGYKTVDDRIWAKQLFMFSIIAITTLSMMMSIDFQRATMLNLLAYLG